MQNMSGTYSTGQMGSPNFGGGSGFTGMGSGLGTAFPNAGMQSQPMPQPQVAMPQGPQAPSMPSQAMSGMTGMPSQAGMPSLPSQANPQAAMALANRGRQMRALAMAQALRRPM